MRFLTAGSGVFNPAPEKCGTAAAKEGTVINPTLRSTSFDTTTVDFWQRIINDGSLQHCDALEKLVAGCEVIAALDDLDLLAA